MEAAKSEEEVSLTENEAEQLSLFWRPLLENPWVKPRTPHFDAPAFIVATDAYKDAGGNGWGVCYLNEDIQDEHLVNSRTVTFGGTFRGEHFPPGAGDRFLDYPALGEGRKEAHRDCH